MAILSCITLSLLLSIGQQTAAFVHSPTHLGHIRFDSHVGGISAQATIEADATATVPTTFSSQSKADRYYMAQAISAARNGLGHTYPNPAVGCVLVQSSDSKYNQSYKMIGSGFHPKAGYPHAEIFALLDASERLESDLNVRSGVDAAMMVVDRYKNRFWDETDAPLETIDALVERYKSEGAQMFDQCCVNADPGVTTTAYVTLEPCCHHGQTPPCASSLLSAGVNRVVIGSRDDNPRVDGGGVTLLRDGGIEVDFVQYADQHRECKALISNFVKRISGTTIQYEEKMTGKINRGLRAHAGRLKKDNRMPEMVFPRLKTSSSTADTDAEPDTEPITIHANFYEETDAKLWRHELVLLRMKNVSKTKTDTKRYGDTIATELNAHVAQVVGHTVLLYRPADPPVLDLEALE